MTKLEQFKLVDKVMSIADEVYKERLRQEEKWKQQNHPFIDSKMDGRYITSMDIYGICSEESAKNLCNEAANNDCLTFGHIIVEELSEAIHAKTLEEKRKELIECAACCFAAIESLDRNGR